MSDFEEDARLGQRVLQNAGWLLSAQLVTAAAGLAHTLLVTRALGAERYGVYVLIVAVVAFVNRIFDSRVWETVTRYVPRFQAKGENETAAALLQLCLLVDLVGATIGVLLVAAFGSLLAHWFIGHVEHTNMLLCYSLVLYIAAPKEMIRALLRVAGRFRGLAFESISVALLQTACAALVWVAGPSIERMLYAQMVTGLVSTALLVFMARSACHELELPVWALSAWAKLRGSRAEILRFLCLTNLMSTARISAGADVLILGFFTTPAAVGCYELGKKMVAQVGKLASSLHRATFPEISWLVAHRKFGELKQLVDSLTRSVLSIVLPFCLIATVFAPACVPLIFGPEFAPAGLVVQILTWQLLRIPFAWCRALLMAVGRVATVAALEWVLAIATPLLLLALVPAFGIIGASVVGLLSASVWAATSLWITRHRDWECAMSRSLMVHRAC